MCCGRRSAARNWKRRSPPTGSASAVSAGPANSWRATSRRERAVLKSRVITAIVLLVLLLAALFWLPPAAWAFLVGVMVMQATSEWTHLSGLGGRKANVYW